MRVPISHQLGDGPLPTEDAADDLAARHVKLSSGDSLQGYSQAVRDRSRRWVQPGKTEGQSCTPGHLWRVRRVAVA